MQLLQILWNDKLEMLIPDYENRKTRKVRFKWNLLEMTGRRMTGRISHENLQAADWTCAVAPRKHLQDI